MWIDEIFHIFAPNMNDRCLSEPYVRSQIWWRSSDDACVQVNLDRRVQSCILHRHVNVISWQIQREFRDQWTTIRKNCLQVLRICCVRRKLQTWSTVSSAQTRAFITTLKLKRNDWNISFHPKVVLMYYLAILLFLSRVPTAEPE